MRGKHGLTDSRLNVGQDSTRQNIHTESSSPPPSGKNCWIQHARQERFWRRATPGLRPVLIQIAYSSEGEGAWLREGGTSSIRNQYSFKYGSKMEPSYGFGSPSTTTGRCWLTQPSSRGLRTQKGSLLSNWRIVGKNLRDSLSLSQTPEPGRHAQENKFKEKAPSWSMSKSARDHSSGERFNLGPRQYDHTLGYKKVVEVNDVSSPGAYERPLLKSRGSIKIA